MRDKIGGVPYETKKSGGSVEIRFYPKGENAKNPDGIVFMLSLSKEGKVKFQKIIDYNEDDCIATRVIKDWLVSLKASGRGSK